MVRAHRSKNSAKLLAIALLGTSVLTSCGLRPQTMQAEAPQADSATANRSVAQDAAPAAAIPPIVGSDGTLVPPNLTPQPQLVRTANLAITVESIDAAIAQARAIARQQQGELLNLQDQTPSAGENHTVFMQIRVPQNKLDAAIAAMVELGTVQQQALKAEDVSDQLVDYQARLRNLRRAEETVLKIMDRSGNIGDVLKVAQELNTIRQNIEQINAQLNALQNRVTYSTIDLHLESAIAPVSAQPPMQTQLTNTWNDATQSIAKFTVDLMQLGIWLMVYSPYLLLIVGAGTFLYWRRQVRTVRE